MKNEVIKNEQCFRFVKKITVLAFVWFMLARLYNTTGYEDIYV